MNVGQLFALGFRGAKVPEWLKHFSEEYEIGAVILFDFDVQTKTYENNVRDVEQLKQLCKDLHSLRGRPHILIDQEGGKVRRLKETKGFASLPSAKRLALLPEAPAILRMACREMKALGIDVDLAPVVDLDLNPSNPDIGAIERSPSSDPDIVSLYAERFFKAADDAGLQLCLKHFPGLGGAKTNSHLDLTHVELPSAEQYQLFVQLAQEHPRSAILVSHAICETWDKDPISVSKASLSELRRHLPNTLLVTDDVQMQGLQKRYSTGEAAIRSIEAGIDWVLVGNNLIDQQAEMAHVAQALRERSDSDPSFRANVEQSLKRISAFKRPST